MARTKKPSADAIERYTQLALERGGRVYGHNLIQPAPEPEVPEDLDASEKRFQAEVVKLFDENGWKWFHLNLPRMSKVGWPDLVVVKHRVIVAELKVKPNTATAAQLGWLDAFQAAGADAHLWYPEDWVEIVKIAAEAPNDQRRHDHRPQEVPALRADPRAVPEVDPVPELGEQPKGQDRVRGPARRDRAGH